MTIDEFKSYMEKMSYKYIGKGVYRKEYGKDVDLPDGTKFKKKNAIEFVLKKSHVLMYYFDGAGRRHKRMSGRLKNMNITHDGRITGMKN